MKKTLFSLCLLSLVVAGCQQFIEPDPVPQEPAVFVAEMEEFEAQTKTSLDENRSVVWSAGDQVAIFQGSTIADKYQVWDSDAGNTNAHFSFVKQDNGLNGDFMAGTETTIGTNVAIYPYESELSCAIVYNKDEVSAYSINNVTIPSVQNYAENSFPNKAFTMVALTGGMNDHTLKFKNVCGTLKLHLKGSVAVKSIELKGNSDEDLAGNAVVEVYPTGEVPSIEFKGSTSKTITLDCGEGVQLSKDVATTFMMAVPPTAFSNGFTLTITDTEGKVQEMSTNKANPIKRSIIRTMPELEVVTKSNLYITCDINHSTFTSEGGEWDGVSIFSNAKTLVYEPLTESGWISIELCPSGTAGKWIVLATAQANNTTQRREAEFKVYPEGEPETHVVISYEQYAQDAYMTYVRKDEFGNVSGISEVKNVTDTSCDYYLKAFADYGYSVDSGKTYDALVFDTNLTDWTYVVPEEDESWLVVGMDPDNNTILIQAGPNEEGTERRSKIEIRSRNTNTLYYTINVIQAPEPVTYITCDINHSTFTSEGGEWDGVSIFSNAKTLVYEPLTESGWISIELCPSSTAGKWIVLATAQANNTTQRREAEFKVYPEGEPETHVVISYEQYAQDAYMTYVRKDEFGSVSGISEVKNVTDTSCDYYLKAFADYGYSVDSGKTYDALVFDTNLTDWTYAVPAEDESWLVVGMDPDNNTILIQAGPNEEGTERRSKIEIRSRNTNTLYYTINVIQAPEPVTYINCDNWGHTLGCDVTYDNNVSVYSNAKELVFEALTDSPWISIELCKANGDHWVVEANMTANTTTERRTAEFKVYPAGKPDTYVILTYEQYGLDAYMTYLRKDEFGASGVAEVKNATATSCDYTIKSFADCGASGNIYDALYFDTNLTKGTWKYVVPEADESWLDVGYDPDQNVILIQAGPNEGSAERRSKIEIRSKDTNTLYYTINVIQAPEPVTYINCNNWDHTVGCDVTYDNNVSVYSNAKELVFEALTDSPWISIELCKASGDHWVVEANMDANTTTEKRTAKFKVYPKGKPDTYVILSYEQYGLDAYMKYSRKDEYGSVSGISEVKNVTDTSCDYYLKAFADYGYSVNSGKTYDALVFNTNLTKGTWTYAVPAEDESWLDVGMDPDNNTILIQAGPNEEGTERRSKIEIRSRSTNTVYYTINVIQAPEPL